MTSALRDHNPAQSPQQYPVAQQERRSRGELVVSRRVVEKIASQAAVEIAAAGGRSGGFLGVGSHADLSSRPKVDVDLSGHTATIMVEVAIAYPSPIAAAAEQVRRRMMSRVGELAGVRVTRVDVTITMLATDHDDKEVLR